MNNEVAEKFLPIGTIVLLKGGKKELMIMSYCIVPSGEAYDKNGKVDIEDKMFDYGGCVYPEGMISSDQLFAFNHEQIEKVCYMGYVTDKQKEISKILIEGLKQRDASIEARKNGPVEGEEAAQPETTPEASPETTAPQE